MSFAPNAFGLHDLGGNVWEYCEDWSSDERKERVMRGGSWFNHERGYLLSSYRGRFTPESRNNRIGFRPVVVVVPSSSER